VARLEDLTPNTSVRGLRPDAVVTVVASKWFGTNALELTYKDASGRLDSDILYRDREPLLEVVTTGRPWSFDGDGALFRLAAEAHRIRLAYLFDPNLAVHTSLVEPLPHQITAVYGEMLSRQPLRFLLADDPGAGKTIMAGLLIKELLLRGDVQRCLVVCPGSLVEQWQDELSQKFGLPFDIVTNEGLEAARSGNWFLEHPLAIARLDKLSRDEDTQAKLRQTTWDMVICDEAHKLSATYFGGEVKYTKRYHLAELLGTLTRHFLLLTATPHNGKEADFQLFMALLDADRFEGNFRDGGHTADVSDLMRRLVKESLLKFDGTALFPERRAYTVPYALSADEAALYAAVTEYVRDEFDNADKLGPDGRRGTVGFALTILQRRLASSPEAIYQSLKRRRERLEKRLHDEHVLKRDAEVAVDLRAGLPALSDEDLDELEDAPDAESEATEERLVDQATAARTIDELEMEIATLRRLEAQALRLRQSGTDSKWAELSMLLQDTPDMFGPARTRRKLVLFTEHRDTLNYLADRIRPLLGQPEAVVTIHGGLGREARHAAQEAFVNDPSVQILIATDAAGEGINLQRAHLMVNYDLPWNPNRLEQRFGRIHRIGQTEVCHLWNLVADETREGAVYLRLLQKLEEQAKALQGRVFDVLGKLTFGDDRLPLRELLIRAIRYGDRADVRARLYEVVDMALDRPHLQQLLEERALVQDSLDIEQVRAIRADLERAAARRLQPHFIASFFLEAFRLLGGTVRERETHRYEVTHVPSVIRSRDRQTGTREPVLPRYERITFEKGLIALPGKPLAAFVCPGHPLLDATVDVVLERYRDLLRTGAVLLDPQDDGVAPRALVALEHAVVDARTDGAGVRRVVSRQLQFVELDEAGTVRAAGYAPYLDYRPLTSAEEGVVSQAGVRDATWLAEDLERRALGYAVGELVPEHVGEVRTRREALIAKTVAAVQERLTREINYWDRRAVALRQQEQAGKTPRLNSANARQRAADLEARLDRRLAELAQQRQISAQPPIVVGGALVVPAGLLRRLGGSDPDLVASQDAAARKRVEDLAMAAVMASEYAGGFDPEDVSAEKRGYDIESRVPGEGRLRFVEVKGRVAGATTVTVTRNEVLTALNKPDDFYLAVVEVDGDTAGAPRYVQRPFRREPDFGVTSVTYDLGELFGRALMPA